ncbi:CHAT domain-containing protein [Streptomyces sp. DR7-3]|uniref:CHAT domain-containing protein n=1 Tax=Streptomyces malaysiensis TaxID=92644 RepID=UPI002044399A|nr:CHAT domain-containing protein [Streptomyces sp. DR7-3]MCM3805958.1 CHAT domain-containing protein [Streptomyces sp. DR7-3]
MAVSTRALYAWRCDECGRECGAPVWRIVDARERADVLKSLGPGMSWVDCSGCGARAYIDAPLLVLRPGAVAPLLLALAVAELQDDPSQIAASLLEEAEQAGGFHGDALVGQPVLLPRSLLPVVLARDLARDLAAPEEAYRQLEPEGLPTVTNYRFFLQYLAEERDDTRVAELLRAVAISSPDELAELLRTHPELCSSTRVRDAGREELRAAVDSPLESVLRSRQRLLEELCDGRTPQGVAVHRYFESLSQFGGDLRARLDEMYVRACDADGPEGILLAREAMLLAADLGEEQVETELAARLGERQVAAARAGLDANLSEAHQVLEHAMSRLTEGSLQWVEVANNLASAHYFRDDGDRLEIWEAARDLLARASKLDRHEYPEYWARIQTNYGLLLGERPGGGPTDLTLGIDRIRAGLEERSPERSTVNWAYSMVNLGLLLYRRAEPEDLRQAELCYRDALHHLSPDDDPALWSHAQCNLADLLLGRDPADAHGARAAATAALDLAATNPGLLDTGRITWLLAQASDQLDGPDSVESIRLRREALAAAPPAVSPSLHLSIARELVEAYASAERWTEAADVASDMLTAVNVLYDAQVTVASRRSVLVQVDRLARWTAFLLARAGRPERAVEAVERGLACELSVVAGRGAADLEALERLDPVTARRYRLARARYRSSVVEPSAMMPGGLDSMVRVQAEAERFLRTVVGEIQAIPGFEDFLCTSELRDIVRAAGGLPLAYLVNAPWGSYVLAIPSAQPTVRAVYVPEVSSVTLLHLLITDPNDDTVGLWLAQQASRLTRRRQLPAALDRLKALEPLMRPIVELLVDDSRHEAVVVPTGLLGLVPLHAVPLGPGTEDMVDDVGTLIITPSAAVYAASRSRAARLPEAAPSLVAVADADGSLPGSRSELAEILTLFEPWGESSCAVGAEATVDWVLDHLAEATYLHLSCHGNAGLDSQGGSLALADGRLDMNSLVRHQLPVCRLTVASACQSGHYEIIEAPDEFLGLPAGFLQAGAACAVTSLWQVDDMATALLMTRFYELLSLAHAPVPALRRSRRWMRRLTWDELAQYTDSHRHLAALCQQYAVHTMSTNERPFASALYWAAFTAWGV